MRISLAGWTSEGLRCPDVTVELRGDDGKTARVALVQMPNGTGKTTTLTLLNAALSGDAANWGEDRVRLFRRPGDLNPRGKFIVRLLVDDRPLTLELLLDFEAGRASYRTTNPGSGGIVPGWSPPSSVNRYLSEHFLKLFIFDGEFADRLFDSRATEADRAIDALCQVYLLDDVARFARDEWDRKVRNAGGTRTDLRLNQVKQDHANLTRRKREVEEARARADRKVASARASIDDLERKVAERLASVASTRDSFAEAQVELAKADAAFERVSAEVMRATRVPLSLHASFGEALVELKENLDSLHLPEETSAQFFDDLVRQTECVCGREMTEGAKNEIRARAKRYLDSAESGTINALKQDVARFVEQVDEAPHEALTARLAELGAAGRACRTTAQSVRALEQRLIDEGDGQLKTWQEALVGQKRILRDCGDIVERIDAAGDEDGDEVETLSLKAIEGALKAADKRISELTSTVELRKQTEALERILGRAAAHARMRIKAELIEECNAKLEAVLANDPLTLASIAGSLRLANQEGASVGQTLAVGYTFLMSVLSRGSSEFPLIVDSPANPMDETVRRQIGSLIPRLCTQFVAFTINTERAGFVPALAQACGDIKYLTLFRKTEGTERLRLDLPPYGRHRDGERNLGGGSRVLP